MDNSDLPLIVAEMLIEIQQLKARVDLLENGFSDVRDGLNDIRLGTRDIHHEILGQTGRLDQIMARIQALLRERPAADTSAAPPETPETPVS